MMFTVQNERNIIMIQTITKLVPKKYYIIDGVELAANDVFRVLETITCEFDDDIDYYLYSCADKLVELGYLTKSYGHRQSIVYEDANGKAKELFDELIHQ